MYKGNSEAMLNANSLMNLYVKTRVIFLIAFFVVYLILRAAKAYADEGVERVELTDKALGVLLKDNIWYNFAEDAPPRYGEYLIYLRNGYFYYWKPLNEPWDLQEEAVGGDDA